MLPEGRRAIPSDFEEEMWGDWFYRLDEMLSDEKMADDKSRTGTDPSFWVRAILS